MAPPPPVVVRVEILQTVPPAGGPVVGLPEGVVGVARVVVEVHPHRGVVAVHRRALRLVRRGRLAVHRTTPVTGVGLEALAVPVGIPMGVEGTTACRSLPRKV